MANIIVLLYKNLQYELFFKTLKYGETMNLIWCPFNRILPKKLISRLYLLLNHNIKSLKKIERHERPERKKRSKDRRKGKKGGKREGKRKEKRVTFSSFFSHPKT